MRESSVVDFGSRDRVRSGMRVGSLMRDEHHGIPATFWASPAGTSALSSRELGILTTILSA